MASEAWKNHEREVATYFRTQRRSRGNDFGISDIEVTARVKDWLGWESKETIIVECKYSKDHSIVDLIKRSNPQTGILVARVGTFLLCFLDDFEDVFVDLITFSEELSLTETTAKYNLVRLDKKEPQYLRDYIDQARKYQGKILDSEGELIDSKMILPIACIAKTGTHGKIVAVHIDDIEKFHDRHGQCSST